VLSSPIVRALLGFGALCLFYLLGVAVRQHYGSCVDIRNTSTETMRQVSVKVETGGTAYELPDLAPGDHRRVYVQPSQESPLYLTITDGSNRSRDITVFEKAEPTDCGLTTVMILPGHRTESNETHRSVCWNGWLAFM
jgi:hypothetical protein